jgi:thiol-disulfide isomerase/thioredoxin
MEGLLLWSVTMHSPIRSLCFSLVCALAAACGNAATGGPGDVVMVGAPLREASMRGLNGPDRQLSQYRGKPLLINVWASWCGPCRMEMGSLERLAWTEQGQRFTIIGISTDDSEPAARAYLRSTNATLTHYIDRALEMENMLGANRLPLTVLVDANGRVLGRYHGAREWDSAQAMGWLNGLLKAADKPMKK